MDKGEMDMGRQRQGGVLPGKWFTVCLIGLFIWVIWRSAVHWMGPAEETGAMAAVERFYKLEQAGDYGSAWEMFHSQMKERYEKNSYIQMRAHVFMQDLGASSFTFEVEKARQVDQFKMSDKSAELLDVYSIPVKQTYHTVFGTFDLQQNCYAAQEQGNWKILWSFSSSSK